MKNLIFLIHSGATLFLVGLIWTIQTVHYPLFANVGISSYTAYQTSHMSRITYIVAPVMFAELLTAIYFIFASYDEINPKLFWFGFVLVLIIWVSTLFIQSPIHGKLMRTFDADLINKLVWTNWIRTFAWTIRGVLVLWMIWLKIK